MKIPFSALSVAALLMTTQAASAQSIYNSTRPATAMPGQSGWVLVASSMNNFHPSIGNSTIAVNSNAAMQPLVAPSIPIYRQPFSTFRTMPFPSVPSMTPAVLPPDQMRPR